MDKHTISKFGWIIIAVILISLVVAFATPFGKAVAEEIKEIPARAALMFGFGDDVSDDEDNIVSHAHDFSELIKTTSATCTTQGSAVYKCECGQTKTKMLSVNPDTHTGSTTTQYKKKDASSHEVISACSGCGAALTKQTEAHSYNLNDVCTKCGTTEKMKENVLVLSANSGTYIRQSSGNFMVAKNLSGGTLSIASSDENIASASINGDNVTITAKAVGTATITVTSAATEKYKKATALFTVTVVEDNVLIVNASGYSGTYDGTARKISVSCSTSGVTITYSTSENGTYSTTNPTYTDVGTYTVYYKVAKAGYTTATGSQTITINRATISTVPSQKTVLTYTGSEQTVSWNDYDGAKMSLGGTAKATNAGSYTATFTPTKNYQWSDGTTTAKTVSWSISKANGKVELSVTSGTITYPNTGSFAIKTHEGGTLSVSTNNGNIATATISGNTVTITPGTTAGTATITVISAANDNYNEAKAIYVITVEYQEDTVAPAITVDVPTLTNKTSVTITGTVTDDNGIGSVSVNGVAIDIENDGSFSVNVELTEGDNTIEIIAADKAGNTTTVTKNAYCDTTAPTLDADIPTTVILNTNSITMPGIVSDNAGIASVTVNGVEVEVDEDGCFEADFELEEGENVITFVATDKAGNTTIVTGNVNCDTTPPVINVVSEIFLSGGSAEMLTGTVTDENSGVLVDEYGYSFITIVGRTANWPAFLGDDGSFNKMLDEPDVAMDMREGENIWTIMAADNAGNVASKTVTIHYSSTGFTDFIVTESNRAKVGYTGAAGENLVIPAVFQNTDGTWYKVVGIDNDAFESCSDLKSVEIPNTVTSIGDWAFGGCYSLESITIPDSVTSIGACAFNSCSDLVSVTFGLNSKLTNIGEAAFTACHSLESIFIPESVASIGDYAFNDCSLLTTIIFEGTKEQWLSIGFGNNWDTGTGSYAITCSNGTITK